MVNLRVLTWNSTGEADGRGAALVNAVNQTNNKFGGVPVQVITIQEASNVGGSIQAALANGPPFNFFVQPQGLLQEHPPPPAQPFRIPPSRSYRVSWMATNGNAPLNLGPQAALNWVPLDPKTDAGVAKFIQAQGFPPKQRANVERAAANMRWPIYQPLLYQARAVHVFTWHVPLLSNWLSAQFSGIKFKGPAFPEAFLFFQHSNFYNQIVNGLRPNDLVVLAGDLNATQADLKNSNILPHFVGVTDNLSSILARSPAKFTVDQGLHIQTKFPPHNIVTARIQW